MRTLIKKKLEEAAPPVGSPGDTSEEQFLQKERQKLIRIADRNGKQPKNTKRTQLR